PPQDLAAKTAGVVARHGGKPGRPAVFFRADDVVAVDPEFMAMARIFAAVRAPLSLAVIPARTTPAAARGLLAACGGEDSLWCWHQHGVDHENRAATGKKEELPDSMGKEQIRAAVARGKRTMEELFGERSEPVYTPPWNRCGRKVLEALTALGFNAVSRAPGAEPPAGGEMKDIPVCMDLHTRKETSPEDAAFRMLAELDRGLESGLLGVMIHHHRMNRAAVGYLKRLVGILAAEQNFHLCHLGDLARA
ncbi:MAG: hypothetical protein JRI97_10890, partial [Deltaproteobacteria bacterium]|nr:hypothetical protein [Deltaproteobacteria bacterium]